MLEICGKAVSNLRKHGGKSTEQLSPVLPHDTLTSLAARVQLAFLHTVIQYFPRQLSTILIRILPLIEHYFYPLSTAPTIIITKEKLKKGI